MLTPEQSAEPGINAKAHRYVTDSRCGQSSKPRLPRRRRGMASNGCQIGPYITMRGFASGAFVVPRPIWLSKGGLRSQPDVVDQMKLATALAFAIATQIHVSHSPAIIKWIVSYKYLHISFAEEKSRWSDGRQYDPTSFDNGQSDFRLK